MHNVSVPHPCPFYPTPKDQGTPLVITGLTLGSLILIQDPWNCFLGHVIAGF